MVVVDIIQSRNAHRASMVSKDRRTAAPSKAWSGFRPAAEPGRYSGVSVGLIAEQVPADQLASSGPPTVSDA